MDSKILFMEFLMHKKVLLCDNYASDLCENVYFFKSSVVDISSVARTGEFLPNGLFDMVHRRQKIGD